MYAKTNLRLVIGTALTALAPALWAQTTQLAAPAQRISDAAIQRDHGAYAAMQARIKTLNDGGRRVRDYHLSKAQCWLDVSFHEYTRNDRSAFPQAALAEAEKLIVAMESGSAPLPWDTPLVNNAARLRPDLWARSEALRSHAGVACAQQRMACAEVELVHAGNEINQQGWRHAKPYVQIAEDQLAEAEQLAARCVPPPAPVAQPAPAAPPAPVAAAPAAPAPEQTLVANVVFNFDRHTRADMRAAGVAELDALLARVKREGFRIEGISLVGHADRLNGTGKTDYNERLAQRRVATVRDYLVSQGIAAASVRTDARGDGQQVQACPGPFKSKAALQECLLPNRRVEVRVTGR